MSFEALDTFSEDHELCCSDLETEGTVDRQRIGSLTRSTCTLPGFISRMRLSGFARALALYARRRVESTPPLETERAQIQRPQTIGVRILLSIIRYHTVVVPANFENCIHLYM